MKRMNLLPPELRPREGNRHGSSYIVVGCLTAAVLAMVGYGAVIRGVNSIEHDIAALKEEAAEAQAQADALSPYGRFADMKERREQSVRAVAATRFNYERLTRELARVLPKGVWVSHLDVAPSEPSPETVAAGSDSATPPPVLGPTMKVSGCAPDQDTVADSLDRMRAITGATNVSLGSSTRDGTRRADSGTEPQLVTGSGGSTGCGSRVAFDATVSLKPAGIKPDTETVPVEVGS